MWAANTEFVGLVGLKELARRTTKSSSRSADTSKERSARVESLIEIPSTRTDLIADQQRNEAIAIAAYYLSEQRRFAPGHEIEDWLMAEAQFEAERAAD